MTIIGSFFYFQCTHKTNKTLRQSIHLQTIQKLIKFCHYSKKEELESPDYEYFNKSGWQRLYFFMTFNECHRNLLSIWCLRIKNKRSEKMQLLSLLTLWFNLQLYMFAFVHNVFPLYREDEEYQRWHSQRGRCRWCRRTSPLRQLSCRQTGLFPPSPRKTSKLINLMYSGTVKRANVGGPEHIFFEKSRKKFSVRIMKAVENFQ